jgi:hypothetical protein
VAASSDGTAKRANALFSCPLALTHSYVVSCSRARSVVEPLLGIQAAAVAQTRTRANSLSGNR